MTGVNLVLLADILVRATPLILCGLAVSTAFKASILNIGAEGQLLIGAAAATAVSITAAPTLGVATLPIALLAGTLAGGLWASIAAVLRVRFHVLEVISTIMLNFVALHTVSYLVRGPLQEPTRIYPQTEILNKAAQLPRLIPGTRLHWGFIIALCIALVTWWILKYTAAGFRLRVTGANPAAAASGGQINTARVTLTTFLASGMLAGLAGAIEVTGVTFALYENISPGYGYTAIAVALLAVLNPIAVIITGLLFGTLGTVANMLQRDANIPSTLVSIIEATIILLVIAMTQFRNGPRMLPNFFRKSRSPEPLTTD